MDVNRRTKKRGASPAGPAYQLPDWSWQLAMPWSLLGALLLSVAMLAMVAGLSWYGYQQLNKPMRAFVVVEQSPYLAGEQLAAQLQQTFDDGFLVLDLSKVHQLVLENPWVMGAQVQREWPGVARIHLQTHEPVARWGSWGLLSQYGEVFYPQQRWFQRSDLPLMPWLNGERGQERQVIEMYSQLAQALAPLNLEVRSLQQTPHGAWNVLLDNEVQLRFGQGQLREKFRRFVQLHNSVLAQRMQQVEVVDMRYDNGAAVSWRSPPESSDSSIIESNSHG